MNPAWIYLLTGWITGFHVFPWIAPGVIAWRCLFHGWEPRRRWWLTVVGLLAALAGHLVREPRSAPGVAGQRAVVTGHRRSADRLLHRVRTAEGRVRHLALPEARREGTRLWVPRTPRLPVIPLSKLERSFSPAPVLPSLVGAVTLGHPAPPRLRNGLRHAGLAHVLAISGLHLSLISLAVLAALGRLHRLLPARWGLERRWVEVVGCLPFVWWYRTLTGGAISTTRAALMMTGWLLGSRFLGAGGVWTGLSWAAACLWIWDPGCWRDPGFQLSFGAVAGIALALRVVPRRPVAMAVAASVGASLATLPLIQLHFERSSPMFLVNNLLFVPLFGLIVIPGAFLVVGLAFLAPPVGLVLWRMADAGCLALAGPLGAWNRAWPEWTPPGTLAWTLALGAAALWVVRGRILRRVVVVSPLVLALVALPWGRVDDRVVRLTFLHVRGEAALVRLPGGRTLLVDAGSAGLAAACARRGVTRLDRVVVTHAHADHVQELARLAEELELGVVWVGPGFPESLRLRLGRLGVPVTPMPACARLGPARIRVRSPHDGRGPAPPPHWSINDASLVIEVAVVGRRFWFLGDVEAAGEAALVSLGPPPGRVDLVKVAHHGRNTSSTPALWRWIRPDHAVVCGEGASSVVLERLSRLGGVVHLVRQAPLELTFAPRSGARERESECEDER